MLDVFEVHILVKSNVFHIRIILVVVPPFKMLDQNYNKCDVPFHLFFIL